MGNHLQRMNFSLQDSDWTNSISVSSHSIDADISGSGHVMVSDAEDNDTSRTARDVSWSVESIQDDVDEIMSKGYYYRGVQLDGLNLLFWLNLGLLTLNTVFLSRC